MKITIIDDHKLFSESLKNLLLSQDATHEVDFYFNAELFLDNLPLELPDIIITDIVMPGKFNGLQLIEKCRELFSDKIKYIILSSVYDVQTIKKAIRLGAKAFLSKNILIEELNEAILMVNSVGHYVSKDLRDSIINTVFTEEQVIYHLSPREKEVMHYVCSGMTIKEIAFKLKLSKHTVQYYHNCVLSKLQLNRTSDLIVFAIKNGLYTPDSTF